MFSRSKKIKFTSVDPGLIFDTPKPASRFLPKWYRKLEGVINGSPTIKKCVPFLDSMASGYMITTSVDVYYNGEGFENKSVRPIVDRHLEIQIDGIDLPDEYHPQPFKWINMFVVETPRGYSSLFLHPLNRPDLPFYSLSGVVETDTFPVQVNFPFFIRKDFRGVIPAGTPIAQVIPFKRNDWVSKVDEVTGIDLPADYYNHANPPFNYYKRNFWQRKKYI